MNSLPAYLPESVFSCPTIYINTAEHTTINSVQNLCCVIYPCFDICLGILMRDIEHLYLRTQEGPVLTCPGEPAGLASWGWLQERTPRRMPPLTDSSFNNSALIRYYSCQIIPNS